MTNMIDLHKSSNESVSIIVLNNILKKFNFLYKYILIYF